MANTDTTTDVHTNIGVITMINTTRRNRPKTLRKPWDYVLTIGAVGCMVDEMKAAIIPLKEIQSPLESQKVNYPARPNSDQVFRSEYPEWKPRVHTAVRDKLHSGAEVHFSVETSSFEVTPNQWNSLCNTMQSILTKHLGEDAILYRDNYFEYIKEPDFYMERHGENKPSPSQHRLYARFDTNIFFEEMLPITTASKTLFSRSS